MATRFYLQASGSPPISPAFDAGWEQTGAAVRLPLPRKPVLDVFTTLADSAAIAVASGVTDQRLCAQFVSDPFRPFNFLTTHTLSLVARAVESAGTANVFLAYVLRALSVDGGTILGTLASSMTNAGTEFPTSAATRIFSAIALSALSITDMFRLVLEIGGHCQAPTANTTYQLRFGTNAASDFALTSALTTDLNPWFELSPDMLGALPANYQGFGSSLGSVSERVR
jgi:hypothetical protein